MIEHVDSILRQLLRTEVTALRLDPTKPAEEEQVRFQAPDDDWRGDLPNLNVGGTPVNALNVYLFDLREARRLRSNERIVEQRNGIDVREPAPFRVDCHYLITAWSPAEQTPALEPAVDEHVMLAQVLAALARRSPLSPARDLTSAQLAAIPQRLQRELLPTEVAPSEGFPKLGELWAAMGDDARWKPGAYLIVTVPLVSEATVVGPPVTAVIADTAIEAGGAERLVVIGGTALDQRGGGSVPLPGAAIAIESAAGVLARAIADDQGRFVFDGLTPGVYTLRGHAPGLAPASAPVTVPSPNGNHDLPFT